MGAILFLFGRYHQTVAGIDVGVMFMKKICRLLSLITIAVLGFFIVFPHNLGARTPIWEMKDFLKTNMEDCDLNILFR